MAEARTAGLALAALGVVYGDIGTSPLYALRECLNPAFGIGPTRANVLGILSLIVWSLILVVSVKYLVVIMRADNAGEGGILALLALAVPDKTSERSRRRVALTCLGVAGAALLYGDGVITPAITVLSAVEGLKLAAPGVSDYVVPLACGILVTLFLFQKRGTERIGRVFGPIMLLWFASLGLLGAGGILREPEVLLAANPGYAFAFAAEHGLTAFFVLGAVFLVVTGGEALYADMGHFGRGPIRLAWFGVALPGLLLNYFGQGALVLSDPTAVQNPFYRLAPAWAVVPLVLLSSLAAVIASQALITGAFSLTRQAIQLGLLPRMRIRHTSPRAIGQIYVPAVNWMLMAACLGLVVGFGSSSALAAAYGLAVTGTMAATTALFYYTARQRLGWTALRARIVVTAFLAIDLAFFAATALKVRDGGWFPLVLGALLFMLMVTWMRGRQLLALRMAESAISVEHLLQQVRASEVRRTPGTAVFLSSRTHGVPPALLQNLRHNGVIHEQVMMLTVLTAAAPLVADQDRVSMLDLDGGFHRVVVRYGFMEEPDVPRALASLGMGPETGMSYFLGGETPIPTARPGMAIWREHVFSFMTRLARPASEYFRLPASQVVVMGVHVEV